MVQAETDKTQDLEVLKLGWIIASLGSFKKPHTPAITQGQFDEKLRAGRGKGVGGWDGGETQGFAVLKNCPGDNIVDQQHSHPLWRLKIRTLDPTLDLQNQNRTVTASPVFSYTPGSLRRPPWENFVPFGGSGHSLGSISVSYPEGIQTPWGLTFHLQYRQQPK